MDSFPGAADARDVVQIYPTDSIKFFNGVYINLQM
jgi:hypothetical protein